MIQSDTLSRQPDFVPDNDNDNDDITMLPEELFINLINAELQQRIVNCTTKDKDATDAITTLLKEGPTSMGNQLDNWTLESFEGKDILFFKGKNYISPDKELRRDIAKMFHDCETAGHPGELETFNEIGRAHV